MIGFTLSYEGKDAEYHALDFYDAAHAMVGFQRSLAITTHLVINGEVITQAPSLRNARIVVIPPEEGSWRVRAIFVAASLGGLGTVPIDTPLGNIIHSAYDYVISESLGFHVDYEKSLGQQYDEMKRRGDDNLPTLERSQFESVIEKCDSAIREMHRPIVKSETAGRAQVYYRTDEREFPLDGQLNRRTYAFMQETTKDERPEEVRGRISSYNMNTYKGRVFVTDEGRPLPFELSETARSPAMVEKITRSLSMNAANRFIEGGDITFLAFKNRSRTGRLKGYSIVGLQ